MALVKLQITLMTFLLILDLLFLNQSPQPNAKPEDFMPNLPNLIELDLGNITPIHVCDIIKSLPAKNSLDSDGISSKLLKKISIELSVPLAHIFNLSVVQGVFPEKLKKVELFPSSKVVTPHPVIITDQYLC